ncbi:MULTISPECIES: hypothetical protein [Sphingobacterium]|jgi:hypothetical protein|uniref:hypothetical protein n=1 Tax=Sphingobacterium TaxID=28453 RepID=UPI0028AEA8F2|nr:hypothetical protein [Sphingobacterium multivorum]
MVLEELINLKKDGYTCLFKKKGSYAYFPSKKSLEKIIENISITPLAEDELITLDDAIEFFNEEDLRYGRILFKTENGWLISD